MYTLSGNPFTLEALHEYYAALDCHTFDKASLVRTQLQHSTTPTDTEAETTEHSLSATEMSAFTQAMINTFVASDTHAYPLQELVARINSDNDTVNQMAVALWIEHFRLLFTEEKSPLALLSTFPEQCATPIQMSAALTVLLEREITIHKILSSGLLQDYAKLNINNMSSVEKTYKRVFPDENDERLSVISRVPLSLTAQPVDTRATTATYVISGKFREDAFETYNTTIIRRRFAWSSVTQERLTTLIKMIGPEVMVQALTALTSQAFGELSQHVEAILAEHTDAELAALFQYISTQVSAEDDLRSNCLAELSERISDDRALSLLRNLDMSPWALLAEKPSLLSQLTERDLEKITQPLTASSDEPSRPFIAPHEINAALDLTFYFDCDTNLSNNIHLGIAEVYLNSTEELALEDAVFDMLRASEELQRWAQEKAAGFKHQWDEVLQANAPTLLTGPHSYQNILDVGQLLRPLMGRLQALGLVNTLVPLNVHAQDAQILQAAITHHTSSLDDSLDSTQRELSLQAHIESVLSLMHPLEKYYREPPPVNRIQAGEQNELRDIGRLAAQYAAREAHKRTLIKEAEGHVALAKARVLLMTACLQQNDACCQLLLNAEKAYRTYIPKLITRDNFILAHATFTDAQLSAFLPYTQLQLSDVITNGFELGYALQHLSETQCNLILDRLPDNLSGIFNNGSQLGHTLEHLNDTQRETLLARLPDDLSGIFTNGSQLGHTFEHLNDTQREIILGKLPNDLSGMITDTTQLVHALKHLNNTQRDTVLGKLPNDLSRIITNGSQLGHTLEHLNDAQRAQILSRLPNDLSRIINCATQLGYVFKYLNETQCNVQIDKFPDNLSGIITTGSQLRGALRHLNLAKCNIILDKLPRNLNGIITNGTQLYNTLRGLNDAKCNSILDKLPENLSGIITNGTQLHDAIKHLSSSQQNAILNRLPDDLSIIITDGSRLLSAFLYLGEELRDTIVGKLPADLTRIITDANQLRSVLFYLNEVQRDTVLGKLPNDLSRIITNGSQLGHALEYLNDTQCNTLLDKLPKNLTAIITDADQLRSVLFRLNETQCNLLLERIKGRLPTLLAYNDYTGTHKDLVNQKLIEVRRYNGQFFDGQEEWDAAKDRVTQNPSALPK